MGSIRQVSIHWDKNGAKKLKKLKVPKIKKLKKLDLWGLVNGKE